MFGSSNNPNDKGGTGNGGKKILENPLPGREKDETVTKEQFAAMGYAERLKLKQENPELFKTLSKH